jgi:hypothetical protein
MTTRLTYALLAVAAMVAVVISLGCGDSTEQQGTPLVATEPTQTSIQDQWGRFAACMRDHGVTGAQVVPGPRGGIRIPGPQGGVGTGRASVIHAADAACHSILKASQHEPTSAEEAAFRDQMLEYVQCLRGQGVDVADPTIKRVAGGFDVDLQMRNATRKRSQAARDACRGQNPFFKGP